MFLLNLTLEVLVKVFLVKEIVMGSFKANSRLCLIRDANTSEKFDYIDHLLLEGQFQLFTTVFGGGGYFGTPPECDGYIITITQLEVLRELFIDYIFLPHKRILVFLAQSENLQQYPFDSLAVLDGLDIVGVFVDHHNLTVTSVFDGQPLVQVAPSKKTALRKGIFGNLDLTESSWTPKFRVGGENYTFNILYRDDCMPLSFYSFNKRLAGLDYKILSEITKGWPVRYIHRHQEKMDTPQDILLSLFGYDMSMCGLWLKVYDLDMVSVTVTYIQKQLTLYVQKPKLLPDSTYTFQPFTLTLWFSTLLMVVVIIGVFCMVLNMDVSSSFICAVRYLSGGCIGGFTTSSTLTRSVFLLWCVTCLILTTAYSAGFSSSLTAPRHEPPIRTLQDVVSRGIKWNSAFKGQTESFEESPIEVMPKLIKLGVNVSSGDELDHLLNTVDFAMSVSVFGYEDTFFRYSINEETYMKLMRLNDAYQTDHLVMPIRKDSPYAKIMNEKIQLFVETGLVSFWYHQTLREDVHQAHEPEFTIYANEIKLKKLTMGKLQGVFYLFVLGNTICLLVFFVEVAISKQFTS